MNQQQFEYSQAPPREHQYLASAVSGDSGPSQTGQRKIKAQSGSFKGAIVGAGTTKHQRQKSSKINQAALQRNVAAPNTVEQQVSQQLDGGAGPLGPQKPGLMHPQQLQYIQNVKSSVSSPNGQQAQNVRTQSYPQGVYGSAQSHSNTAQHRQHMSAGSTNSHTKQTPNQMGGAYSAAQQNAPILKSESSAGHIKFSEPSSSIGMHGPSASNVPSSFQSSFAGLPKVNNQTQQHSLQHQQEQLRAHLYGSSVAQSIDLAGSNQKLPGTAKLNKKRIKSSGKIGGQAQAMQVHQNITAPANADESQYANLPTSSQQSFANVPSEHGHPLRASQNMMSANHQRIQSNPVVLKDINQFVSSQGGSDMRKQVAGAQASHAKQTGSFQSSAGMVKANQKRAIQTRERMGQILDTGSVNQQQQVLGHAKYLGQSMHHQAQTVQASAGNNSLAQSTTGLNKAFSKVLHSLGSDGGMVSRQEAVNTQNMMPMGNNQGQKIVKTAAHGNPQGVTISKAPGNAGHKIKTFSGVTTSHHQKALSMQSYLMQPKQLSNTQHAQAGNKKAANAHSGNSIGAMTSTGAAASHQSATGTRKKTSQQLSFANDPHVVNTMMAAPGTAHTQQRAELFSHAALPGTGPALVGSINSGARTSHQSSMNAIGLAQKGTGTKGMQKGSAHMTPGAAAASGTGAVSGQFSGKMQANRGPHPQKQHIKNSQTSPRTSMNISQSISPSQAQYKAANLKQPHHRHTNTAAGAGPVVSQKAALLQQQIMMNPSGTSGSHRRQGTLDFSSGGQLNMGPVGGQGNNNPQYQRSSQNIMMAQKLASNPPAAKKHDGPISAAAGDISSVPASLANSSHYIRAPPSGANTSMSKAGGAGASSAVHSSGTHRRIKSDQVELLGGQPQYDAAPIPQHGQAQSSQIVVINNNNTFEFQMHGTNINIHHNHPSNYNFSVANNNGNDIELTAAQMQELHQMQGMSQQQKTNHYFKMGGSQQQEKVPAQQSRKSMQKAKYERLMKGDRDGSEMAPLKSATQTQGKSYAQSKSILSASHLEGTHFAISQSIDVTGRTKQIPQTHLNSGRPPSTSAASAERQRYERGQPRRDDVSAPRSIDQSATRSKLRQTDGQSRVGSAKRALHSRQKTIQRGTSGNSKKQSMGVPGHQKAASHADGFFGQAGAKGGMVGESAQRLAKRKASNTKAPAQGLYVAQTGSRKNQLQPNHGDKQGMIVSSAERSARIDQGPAPHAGHDALPGQEMIHSNFAVSSGQGAGYMHQYQSSGTSSQVTQPATYGSLGQGNAPTHFKQKSASNLQTFSDGSGAQPSAGHASIQNKMYMLRQKEPMQNVQQPGQYVNNQERPSAVTASQRTLMQHQLVSNQGNATGPRAGTLIQSHQGPINYVGKHKKVNSTAVAGSGQQKLYQIIGNQTIEQKGPKLGQGPPGGAHLQQISKTPDKLVMSAQALKNSGHQKLAPSQMHGMVQEPYVQSVAPGQPRQLSGQPSFQQVNSTGAIQPSSSSQFLKKIKGNQVRRDTEDEPVMKQNLISGLRMTADQRPADQIVTSSVHQQKLLAKNRLVQSDLQQRRAGSQISMSRRSNHSNERTIARQSTGQPQDNKDKKPVESVLAWKMAPNGAQLTPRRMIFNQILQNIHQGTMITKIDYYKIGKVIGKGAFGKVNLAIHRLTGKFVALKSINKTFMSDESSLKKVMQEYNILKRARHKNIVRLYESFETEQHIVYVMEVCGGGDLLTYVRRRRKLKEDLAKFVFRQLIQGISYVNSKRVLHRDIKLDNILLTSEGDVKICDFGVSKLVQSATATQTEQCGTPAYIAPEVFKGRGYRGFQSDIWSAGVVLYAMLFGTVPFKATNMAELQKQIIKVDCSWGQPGEITPAALSLLQRILEVDPNKRLTPQQIMSDPWMMLTEQQARQIEVFTEHEKKKIVSEFEYYNQKKEAEEGSKQDDPFLEQMLQTTENELIKNNTTKSVILAPFNSTKSHISDNFYKADSIQEIMVSQSALTFCDRCREVNRQYMLNNNAELDNGVYNEQEDKKKDEENDKQQAEKKPDDGLTGLDQQIDNLPPVNADDGGAATPILDSNLQSQLQSLNTSQQMVDADRVERMEEEFGFEYNYVIDQLENDQLNHATTTYFLMDTEKEF